VSQKIPSKTEHDALRRALDGDFSPVSSPDSPLIDRQPIRRSIEADLKAACRVLVEHTGNAHHNSQEDALVNFSSLQRAAQHKSSKKTARTEKSDKSQKVESSAKPDTTSDRERISSRPAQQEAPVSQPSEALPVVAPTKEPNEELKDEPSTPNKDEMRAQFPVRRDSLSSRKHALTKPRVITSKSELASVPDHTHRSHESESSSSNVSVGDSSPMTASTDHQPQLMSTAPTTVSVTPATRPVRKGPTSLSSEGKALQVAVTKSERKAAEFLREDVAVVVEPIVEEVPTINTESTMADQQEEKSFVGGLREFVRSRSRSRSRSREPGSLRRATSTTIQGLRSGWDGLRRKQSINDLSAITGTAPTPNHSHEQRDDRSDVNLNRDLPPLPSLVTFKQAQERQEKLNKEAEMEKSMHMAAEQSKLDENKVVEENPVYELEGEPVIPSKNSQLETPTVKKVWSDMNTSVDDSNYIEKKLDAEMKKIDQQKKNEEPTAGKTRRTTVHIVTAQRPKTSGSVAASTRTNTVAEPSLKGEYRTRSTSLKSTTRKPSVSVGTATMVPVRKYSMADSETKTSSKDSCFSDNESDCPKRSMDIVKSATLAHKPSIESFRQINIKSRRSTTASHLSQSHAPSQPSSRPQSRAAPTTPGTKTPSSVRYTIIPHQRTPSQPVFMNRSAASSVVNLPPRPATRDASSIPSRSRMPSVTTRGDYPPLPPNLPNFSRKMTEGASRPTTSAAQPTYGEITALPPFPSKKPFGLRRMLSSFSVKKMKSIDVRWTSRDHAKTSGQIAVA